MLSKRKEVIKHSSAIQISNKVTLLQRKLWNLLLANAYSELGEKKEFHVSIASLTQHLGFNSHNEQHLKDSLRNLVGCTLEWNVLSKDKKNAWKITSLLSEATIKDGVLTYEYASSLQEKLHNPSMYARINLSIQNTFDSKHALALYELFIDYFDINRQKGETAYIRLEEFRILLGLQQDEYKLFKDLNKSIIKKALNEINKKTELDVNVSYQKHGKRVVAIKFIINKQKEEIPTLPIFTSSNSLEKTLLEYGFNEKEITNLIQNYASEHLEKALGISKKEFQKGNITKSLKHYTKAVIEKLSPLEVKKETQKKEELQQKFQLNKELEEQQEKKLKRKKEVEKYLASLSPTQKKKLEDEFIQELKEKYVFAYENYYKGRESLYESSVLKNYFFNYIE